ncbi:MAG: hypothetical protein MPJ06_07840 [Nitrosopumilus sp.]|nr:hypothetical protein [Nitrosopumilus sp.]MDA7942321.1 hypothetical protein [Nitrosopumilus sp.]MDA7943893.1 hypothetical protein [Nitrosopumilus sp.]MDA7945251.1 hypothetical protein [Nitrosopumilus sp.]MDA7955189.1 hypothetical protein [Nitrosopumilus sp.]
MARTSTVKRFSLPLRVCRRCKVILIHERAWVAEWKIWNKREYIGRID